MATLGLVRFLLIASALLAGACGTTVQSVPRAGPPRGGHDAVRATKKTPAAKPPARAAKGIGSPRCAEVLPLIKKVAKVHSVDVGLVVGIVRVESSFRVDAENSTSGATGLMQIMPATGKGFECGDLYDAEDNLQCGVRVLKRYLDRYEGNMAYGLAAYNSGPKAPDKAWAEGRLPRNLGFAERVLRERARFLRGGCG